ncbi:MAG: DMT family transporter [Pseudomonadota bacterium]
MASAGDVQGWWRAQTPVMRGVTMMCLSSVAFSAMHVSIRHVSGELHPFQIALFRNLFGLAFLAPLLMGAGLAQLRTRRLPLHAARGLVNIGAMLMFFYALSITPVATVTALSFAGPVFTAVLSVLVLGERFRLRRWAAIGFGVLGMLIILRPGIAPMETGPVLALAAAALWSVALILIKIISRTESSVAITAWMGIFLSAFSLGPALWVWQTPSAETWGWLIFIGLAGSAAQVSLAQSLSETEPTAVMPFDFLKLIWTTLLGAWAFGELPDVWVYLGAAVIFVSGIYIAWRERQASRAEAAG